MLVSFFHPHPHHIFSILSTVSLLLFQEVELGEACLYRLPELATFLSDCVNVNMTDFVSDLYDIQLYIDQCANAVVMYGSCMFGIILLPALLE